MKICVVGEKGGTGKTTLSTGLAACLAGDGRDVLLVDADTQRTAMNWAAIRASNDELAQLSCVSVLGAGMAKEVRKLADRYEDLIIDTGGRDTLEMRAALTVSDVAILPFQPSQFDLWTVEKMYELLEATSVLNPELKVLAVMSRVETNATTVDYLDAQQFLKEYESIALATSPIRNRVAFKRASSLGMNVIEYENDALSKSSMELKQLYKDIFA